MACNDNYYGELKKHINHKIYSGDWCLEIDKDDGTVDLVTPLLSGSGIKYAVLVTNSREEFPSPAMIATLFLMYG